MGQAMSLTDEVNSLVDISRKGCYHPAETFDVEAQISTEGGESVSATSTDEQVRRFLTDQLGEDVHLAGTSRGRVKMGTNSPFTTDEQLVKTLAVWVDTDADERTLRQWLASEEESSSSSLIFLGEWTLMVYEKLVKAANDTKPGRSVGYLYASFERQSTSSVVEQLASTATS